MDMPLIPRSPLFYASIGLVVLAFGAPGRAHAEIVPLPDDSHPLPDDPHPLPEDTDPPPTRFATPPRVEPAPEARPRTRWDVTRIEAAFGVRFGSFTIDGDSSGTAIPFHLDLGVRHQRWLVFGSYDVLGVTTHVPATVSPDVSTARPADATGGATGTADLGGGTGLVHRLGANVRYIVGRSGESDGGFEAFVEGGVGVQHLVWDAGGTWTRPDVALGIGGTILGLGWHRHAGLTLGLRVMLSHRNDTANRPPVCGGPCDTATPPSSVDRSFLFDVSIPFGN